MANFTLSIENCLIQVRARLQEEGIKLWLEPYYFEGIGAVDAELEVKKFRLFSSNCYEMNFFIILQRLALTLGETLNLPHAYCLAAVNELQTNAVDKLKSRELFRETGNDMKYY